MSIFSSKSLFLNDNITLQLITKDKYGNLYITEKVAANYFIKEGEEMATVNEMLAANDYYLARVLTRF